jgi:hypothetical protein
MIVILVGEWVWIKGEICQKSNTGINVQSRNQRHRQPRGAGGAGGANFSLVLQPRLFTLRVHPARLDPRTDT